MIKAERECLILNKDDLHNNRPKTEDGLEKDGRE